MKIQIIMGIFILFMVGCSDTSQIQAGESLEELCKKDGNMFMKMGPVIDGVPTGDPACAGCMIGNSHICEIEEYKEARENLK